MVSNSYYSQEGHGPYELHDIGNLDLEDGGAIRGCKLAVATHGTLTGAKDNAILIPTWYSGTSKIIEQVYIGKGRALDPDKYFIIVVNQIGSGCPPRRTTRRARRAWPTFRRCASATTCARSTDLSPRSSG
jgi:homoserine O-acetyltransferase